MAATNHVANSLLYLMGKLKWKTGYFNIFFKNLIDLWEKKSFEQYWLGTFLFYSGPPNQRIMGDVTTVFITETYHIYLWTNNSVFLKDMWPHVVEAIAWMIDWGTKGNGLPYRLQCTYDQLFLSLYDHDTWSEEDGYYHAWWDKEKGSPSWLMSDSLYAQVWAYTLGLGHLDDPKRLGCNFRLQDSFLLPGFEFSCISG